MRVVKKADVRKNEILDAASVLFAEKGFEDASVADIMNAVGIAKGTLYHHFKSKEEIMDALIQRQMSGILLAAEKVAEDQSIPVKERMLRTILALHVEDTEQTEGREIMAHLHKPKNVLMHQKTKQILFQRVPPILAGILKEGIAQGLFDTSYPLECMEIALCYLDMVLDDDMLNLTQEQRLTKVNGFFFHLERLLGVERGSLASFEQVFLKGEQEQ